MNNIKKLNLLSLMAIAFCFSASAMQENIKKAFELRKQIKSYESNREKLKKEYNELVINLKESGKCKNAIYAPIYLSKNDKKNFDKFIDDNSEMSEVLENIHKLRSILNSIINDIKKTIPKVIADRISTLQESIDEGLAYIMEQEMTYGKPGTEDKIKNAKAKVNDYEDDMFKELSMLLD